MSAQLAAKATAARPPSASRERGRIVAKTKLRTTIEPVKVLEVDDAEFVDLSRQGLIHSHDQRDGSKSPHRWRDGKPEAVESGVVTDKTPAALAAERNEDADASDAAEKKEKGN